MAFEMPPGLCRPSSWPVRQQRRHVATAQFNNQVLDSLTTINSKVEGFSFEADFNRMSEQIDKLQSSVNLILQRVDIAMTNEDLEKRLESMELLLFRRNFKDFVQIDRQVLAAVPASQPEPEASPLKAQQITKTETELSNPRKCINFDIFSEAEDYNTDRKLLTKNASTITDRSHGTLQDLAGELEALSLNGEWVPLESPRINDLVYVEERFLSMNDVQINLERLWIGRVIYVDAEGDAQVVFPLCPTAAQWLPKNKFAKMRVQADANIPEDSHAEEYT